MKTGGGSTGKSSLTNLGKTGWSWGCVSAIDSAVRTIWIVDAHQGNGKRFVVRADEKLTAFMELESAIRTLAGGVTCCCAQSGKG
jgi:hypothetical protein